MADWERAGKAVARRRRQLGWTDQNDAAAAAGIGVTNWREVEAGAANKRVTSLAAIASALRWPPDMIERIAEGEDPPENGAEDRVAMLEDRLDAMSAEVTELRAAVATIQAALSEWLRLGAQR